MLRFSHFDVPVGQVPSTGNALTGSRSPWLASITAVTRFTKSGACGGTGGGRWREAVGDAGTATSCEMGERRVHRLEIALYDHVSAAFPVGLLDRVLDLLRSPRSRGSTPEIAKKQVCMIVLMRVPMPAALATA